MARGFVTPKKLAFWRRPKRRRYTDKLSADTSQIGDGFLLHGDVRGQGSYRVQGEIVGNGEFDGAVILVAGSCWKGLLTADYVQVAGRIDGNVEARERIELTPTAVVSGDLNSPVIAIAAGAQIEGAIVRPRMTQVFRFTERRGRHEDRPEPG